MYETPAGASLLYVRLWGAGGGGGGASSLPNQWTLSVGGGGGAGGCNFVGSGIDRCITNTISAINGSQGNRFGQGGSGAIVLTSSSDGSAGQIAVGGQGGAAYLIVEAYL